MYSFNITCMMGATLAPFSNLKYSTLKWPHKVTQGGQNSKWSKSLSNNYVKLLVFTQGL